MIHRTLAWSCYILIICYCLYLYLVCGRHAQHLVTSIRNAARYTSTSLLFICSMINSPTWLGGYRCECRCLHHQSYVTHQAGPITIYQALNIRSGFWTSVNIPREKSSPIMRVGPFLNDHKANRWFEYCAKIWVNCRQDCRYSHKRKSHKTDRLQ